jgi:hypothetical protein
MIILKEKENLERIFVVLENIAEVILIDNQIMFIDFIFFKSEKNYIIMKNQ